MARNGKVWGKSSSQHKFFFFFFLSSLFDFLKAPAECVNGRMYKRMNCKNHQHIYYRAERGEGGMPGNNNGGHYQVHNTSQMYLRSNKRLYPFFILIVKLQLFLKLKKRDFIQGNSNFLHTRSTPHHDFHGRLIRVIDSRESRASGSA